MDLEDVVLIAVEDNAAIRQLAECLEMMFPPALGVEESLVAVLPELLDTRLERGPVVGVETPKFIIESDATIVTPLIFAYLLES